jgi:hypothetical protein
VIFNCPECTRLSMALNRLQAKHRKFADETNKMLTEQHAEITHLREALGVKDR